MKKISKLIVGCMCMGTIASCMPQQPSEVCEKKENDSTLCISNAVIENMMARRSIRKYKPLAVERGILDQIMKCGIHAPNGMNRQSWEVRVVDRPEIMEELKQKLAEAYPDKEAEQVTGCFRDAPVMVFIARDKAYDFSAYDCGLMAENMVLAATSLGVGSICLGSPVRLINDNAACAPILQRLSFSEGYELCLCVGLGYADEAPEAKPRDTSKVKYVE